MKKFALIGTSSSGKTTFTYGLVSRLKSYGILADGVFNQDRKFSFDRRLVESEESAQNWMVTNIISKEIDIGLHEDVDVLVSDRSAVDLYAYYHYQYPDSDLCKSLGAYVKEWAKTYSKLYYLEPLAFHDDGKRPSDEFRLAVDNHLREVIMPQFDNIKYLNRADILNDILLTIGFDKPGVKDFVTETDIQAIANSLGKYVVYKPAQSVPKDTIADIDLYVYHEDVLDEDYLRKVTNYIQKLLGAFVLLDVSLTATTETFCGKFHVVHPENKNA